ncbi:unnamed protein product [Trichobilharzia regenti]|nr:unnamed protein product [Trichobilharzia regenti]
MNSLWHLLPNHLVSTAQSVLFNPSDCYSCNSSDHSHVRGVGDNAAAAAVDDNRRRVKSSTNGHYALCELFSNCINTLLIKKSVSIHFCYPAHTCKDGVIDSHPCLLNILRLYCGIVGEPSFKPWKILSPSLNPEKSSSHQNNDLQISMHIKSVKYVLKSVKKLVLSVQKENNLNANSPFMKRAIELRRDVYTLTIQFLACVAADSSDLRLFILKSSEFSTFSTELFTDSSFAAEGINRSITSALEVLFTWFAYTKVEQSGCAIHPFDKFCLEQLTALIRDYALTSTLPFSLFDLDHDMTKGPRDLQAVLLTAICSRIKLCKPMKVEESEVNENTSLLRGIEDSIISCSSHTMSSMSFEYLLIIFKMISNYLYHRLRCLDHQFSTSSSSSSGGNIVSQRDVNNNNNTNNFEAYFLCLSSYSTVIDEEHEFYNKNSTLWSTMASNRIRQLGSSIIPDQLPENPASLATLYMNRLTCYCCYLPGICSAGNAYSQILSTSLYHDKCLSIILGNLCKILIENSTSTDRQKLLTYFTKHTELFLASLRVSHVPASLSTMITLSCLINGWKTLRRLTELIIRHFKAYSICDWVFYCVLTITTYSSSSTSTNTTAENSMHTTRIVKHLIHSLLSTYPLNSCCLFLLLSLFISTDTSTSILCNKDYADIILQTFVDDTQCLAVMIENQIIAFPSSSPYFKLSLEYTNKRRNSINSSELGQALLNQSLCFNIPCYQQSSALNFQCLNQSLPIGLSGPIHAFKQSSIKCLQDIIDLNYPSRKDKQTSHTITNTTAASCQCPSVNKTLVGKSELKALATICRRKDLLDFAPTALIYSDILDEQMASFCRTLSVIDDYNVGDCENNIIYPMYLGYSAYKSAPMTCTESGVIEEEDDLKNSNTTATTSTTHDNANKSSNDSNTNNVDLSSKLLVEKFSLSELTRTSFIFQNDNECLQIVVRLPCLIQLECVYLSTKNSAISGNYDFLISAINNNNNNNIFSFLYMRDAVYRHHQCDNLHIRLLDSTLYFGTSMEFSAWISVAQILQADHNSCRSGCFNLIFDLQLDSTLYFRYKVWNFSAWISVAQILQADHRYQVCVDVVFSVDIGSPNFAGQP